LKVETRISLPSFTLLPQLPASSRLHKDFCSSLALKSHGSLFSLSSPSRETVWPLLILKAAHTRVCEVCDCVAGDDLMGRLQCDPCATGVDYVDEYEEVRTRSRVRFAPGTNFIRTCFALGHGGSGFFEIIL
jgi:hypothetical protein